MIEDELDSGAPFGHEEMFASPARRRQLRKMNRMTKRMKIEIVTYLVKAAYDLSSLDGTEEWGWDGIKYAKALCDEFGLDMMLDPLTYTGYGLERDSRV